MNVTPESLVKGPVAQWIRHLTTNQGIPGSSPGRVVFFSPLVDCFSFLFSFLLSFYVFSFPSSVFNKNK